MRRATAQLGSQDVPPYAPVVPLQTSPTPVLIMNYDHVLNRCMRAVLRASGIGADLAERVSDGLSLLRAGRYSLLICRYALCLELDTDVIGGLWKKFGVPGMLLTGTLTPEAAAERVLPAAFRGALITPLIPEEFVANVRAQLGDPCPDCRGTGEILLLVKRMQCPACAGRGWTGALSQGASKAQDARV